MQTSVEAFAKTFALLLLLQIKEVDRNEEFLFVRIMDSF